MDLPGFKQLFIPLVCFHIASQIWLTGYFCVVYINKVIVVVLETLLWLKYLEAQQNWYVVCALLCVMALDTCTTAISHSNIEVKNKTLICFCNQYELLYYLSRSCSVFNQYIYSTFTHWNYSVTFSRSKWTTLL